MKIKQFQIGGMGEIYILTEEGKFYQGERDHVTGEIIDLKLIKIMV